MTSHNVKVIKKSKNKMTTIELHVVGLQMWTEYQISRAACGNTPACSLGLTVAVK